MSHLPKRIERGFHGPDVSGADHIPIAFRTDLKQILVMQAWLIKQYIIEKHFDLSKYKSVFHIRVNRVNPPYQGFYLFFVMYQITCLISFNNKAEELFFGFVILIDMISITIIS